MIDPSLKNQALRFHGDTLSESEESLFAKALAENPELIMETVSLFDDETQDADELIHPPTDFKHSLCDLVFPPENVDYLLAGIPERNSAALVVADINGLIEWVSPAFTRMCGYSLAELRGNKAGSMLQGPETDPAAVDLMRNGLRENREVTTQLINYHKNGDPYEVEIRLSPVRAETGDLVGYLAVETQL